MNINLSLDNKFREYSVRSLFFFVGVITLGFGIALLVISDFGVGPWDLVYVGLSNKIGLSMGVCMNIVAIIQVLLAGVISNKIPQFLSLITSAFIGLFVDLWMIVLNNLAPDSTIFNFIIFLISLFIISLGASIYIRSKYPVAPLDYLMVCSIDKFNLSLSKAKIACEGIGLLIGILLGGPIGVGTIIILFSIGPLMQFLHNLVDKTFELLSNSNAQKTLNN